MSLLLIIGQTVLAETTPSTVLETDLDPDTVDALLNYEHFQPDADVDRTELANWFSVARILLNLDETIHRG